MEEIEEKDNAALVEAQSRDEESAFLRELEEGDETNAEALRTADEMDSSNDSAERTPKVSSLTCHASRALCWHSSELANYSYRSRWARLQVRLSKPCYLRRGRIGVRSNKRSSSILQSLPLPSVSSCLRQTSAPRH
jgi:hypothetical protein